MANGSIAPSITPSLRSEEVLHFVQDKAQDKAHHRFRISDLHEKELRKIRLRMSDFGWREKHFGFRISDFGLKILEEQGERGGGKGNFGCRLPAAGRDYELRKREVGLSKG